MGTLTHQNGGPAHILHGWLLPLPSPRPQGWPWCSSVRAWDAHVRTGLWVCCSCLLLTHEHWLIASFPNSVLVTLFQQPKLSHGGSYTLWKLANATKQGPPKASCYAFASLPLKSTHSSKPGSGRPISQSLSWNLQVRDEERWSDPPSVHPSHWCAGAGFLERPLCASLPSAPLDSTVLLAWNPPVLGWLHCGNHQTLQLRARFCFLRAVVKHVQHTSCPVVSSSLQRVVECWGKVAFPCCGQAPSSRSSQGEGERTGVSHREGKAGQNSTEEVSRSPSSAPSF